MASDSAGSRMSGSRSLESIAAQARQARTATAREELVPHVDFDALPPPPAAPRERSKTSLPTPSASASSLVVGVDALVSPRSHRSRHKKSSDRKKPSSSSSSSSLSSSSSSTTILSLIPARASPKKAKSRLASRGTAASASTSSIEPPRPASPPPGHAVIQLRVRLDDDALMRQLGLDNASKLVNVRATDKAGKVARRMRGQIVQAFPDAVVRAAVQRNMRRWRLAVQPDEKTPREKWLWLDDDDDDVLSMMAAQRSSSKKAQLCFALYPNSLRETQALYPFLGVATLRELSFRQGETLLLLKTWRSRGWGVAKNALGQRGYVPLAFLAAKKSKPAAAAPAPQPTASVTTPRGSRPATVAYTSSSSTTPHARRPIPPPPPVATAIAAEGLVLKCCNCGERVAEVRLEEHSKSCTATIPHASTPTTVPPHSAATPTQSATASTAPSELPVGRSSRPPARKPPTRDRAQRPSDAATLPPGLRPQQTTPTPTPTPTPAPLSQSDDSELDPRFLETLALLGLSSSPELSNSWPPKPLRPAPPPPSSADSALAVQPAVEETSVKKKKKKSPKSRPRRPPTCTQFQLKRSSNRQRTVHAWLNESTDTLFLFTEDPSLFTPPPHRLQNSQDRDVLVDLPDAELLANKSLRSYQLRSLDSVQLVDGDDRTLAVVFKHKTPITLTAQSPDDARAWYLWLSARRTAASSSQQ